jgi:hypothetical protein
MEHGDWARDGAVHTSGCTAARESPILSSPPSYGPSDGERALNVIGNEISHGAGASNGHASELRLCFKNPNSDVRRTPMKRSAAMLLLSVLIVATGIVPANALARSRYSHHTKATVTWSLSRTGSEGAPIPFSWSAKHLGRRYRLVIQRPFGTVHVWRSILRLRARSGSAELPGYKLGVHRFRIAAFRGRKLLAKRVTRIKIFGTVQFTTLLRNEHPDVHTMPTNSLPYVARWEYVYSPESLFGVSNNHCSSVHVAFATGVAFDEEGVGTVTIVQESRNPVSGSAPYESVGSVDAELIPGQTWGVNASTTGALFGATVYINGYATCYSTEPFSE